METGIKHISFPFNKIQFLLQMNFFYVLKNDRRLI